MKVNAAAKNDKGTKAIGSTVTKHITSSERVTTHPTNLESHPVRRVNRV